jgi:ABC-2 type transport system permease protein
MTAMLAPATSSGPVSVGTVKVTQTRVLRSEWTKFRTVRSTLWTLGSTVVLFLGIGALFTAVIASQWSGFDAGEKAQFDPISASLQGITFAQLALGVLGVLLISGEYTTGMIRASLTAVPRRLPVLWGKLAVFAGVVFTVSLVTSFVSFFVGQALLNSNNLGTTLGAPGAVRSVIGAALYLTVAGMLALALGGLLRNTAAAISIFVGVFFVLPLLAGLLPVSIRSHLVQYLPSNAGGAIYDDLRDVANPLSPWAGFSVLCLYAAILIGAAAWRLRHSDA